MKKKNDRKPAGVESLPGNIRAATENLRSAEAKYRFLTEEMNDVVWTTDLEMRTTYVSPSIEKVLGFTPTERMEQSPEDQAPPATLRRAGEKLAEELRLDPERDPGRSITLILDYYHRDGSIRNLETRLSFIRDEKGNPVGVYGLSRDVTDRLRIEKERRERIKELEALYGLSSLIERRGITPEELYREVPVLLAKGLQHPESAWARVALGDREYRTGNFRETAWKHSAPIRVHGSPAGRIDIGYLEKTPPESAEPFLEEEKRLLDVFAERLGRFIEQRRSEDELRQSEARFRAIFDRAQDAIFIETPEGRILDANEAAVDMLGYSREELLEMEVADLLPAELAAGLSPTIRPETVAGRIYIETENVRKDGTRVPVEVGNTLVEIGGEKRVIAILRDISDRKRAEDELRRSEARFKNILLHAPLAIQGYRIDGTVVYWNRESERVYGYAAEEAVGGNLGDLIIPDEIRPIYEESLSACAALEKSGEFMPAGEVSLRRKDGSRVSVHSIHTAVCIEGEEPMLFCIDLDLSERKRMEAERLKMERRLQQTQKLESLGVLAGGIAHDFNNILMVILGNAELALREMRSLSPARESVAEISAASRQASELCKQMLAYAGRASYLREPLDLATLIEGTTHLIKVLTSRDVVLKYKLEPAPFEGDPSQIRQVVMNLVTNSSEAIGERAGLITITTGKTILDGEEARRRDPSGELRAGEYVWLRVADDGRGMDEETRRRVFEPFFTTKFTGRGLGLAAVLGIVQGHGGAILVESEPEAGTTFQVLLPARLAVTGEDPVVRRDLAK